MPQTDKKRAPASDVDALRRAYEALYAQEIEQRENELSVEMKQKGFTSTLKSLNKGKLPTHIMSTVSKGVLEELPCGRIDASLHTDKGLVVLRNAERTDHQSPDPQQFSSSIRSSSGATADSEDLTTDELLHQLTDAGINPTCSLICLVELARFNSSQNQTLLPLLWQYILHHRNSNDQSELIAVGAAIRKYIAIMPMDRMDRMDELAVLLESGNKSPLPIDLEIEVAKMIYRNFEIFPPDATDLHPELAQRLLEMAQAYTNPRILLRDKHAAAASLAIEAIVAMRSPLAEKALQAAIACPYRWFTELVSDDLDELQDRWIGKSEDAAGWLSELRSRLLTEK